jgi:hypothetical protein
MRTFLKTGLFRWIILLFFGGFVSVYYYAVQRSAQNVPTFAGRDLRLETGVSPSPPEQSICSQTRYSYENSLSCPGLNAKILGSRVVEISVSRPFAGTVYGLALNEPVYRAQLIASRYRSQVKLLWQENEGKVSGIDVLSR